MTNQYPQYPQQPDFEAPSTPPNSTPLNQAPSNPAQGHGTSAYPGYSPAFQTQATQTTAPQPTAPHTTAPRQRRGLTSLLAVAVLAAGIGGGSAVAAERYLSPSATATVTQSAGTNTTVTKVVQGSSSNPDWTTTAATASSSVVSISVSSGAGQAEGTGVIWDTSGHIVTNNHVVTGVGSGATITVTFGNASYSATVVGTDPTSDLAVIKVEALPKGSQPITVADSDKVTVGQAVMAIGNPLGLSDTVTTGIISALNRPVVTTGESTTPGSQTDAVYTNAIQTSAPINPGNSGGALVNANGELVGINSAIASLSSSSSASQSGSIGIGFAIPSNDVEQVVKQLIASGSAQHAYLGVSSSDGTAKVDGVTLEGATVRSVAGNSPAASAGLQTGDVITAVNGTNVTSTDSLVAQIRSAAVGEKVTLTVVRGSTSTTLTATLVAAPQTGSTGTQPQVGGR